MNINGDVDINLKYIFKDKIGQGSYSDVYSAINSNKQQVVIKALKQKIVKSKDSHENIEVDILPRLQHDNILSSKEVYSKSGYYYLVFDEMKSNLDQYIKTVGYISRFQIQIWMYQLLSALEYCHNHAIIHEDIKPENILIDSKNDVKLADFGSATHCGMNSVLEIDSKVSTYSTLRYAAPELLLETKTYTNKVDIWSLGCVFAELLSNNELFSGSCISDQIDKIFALLGTPTHDSSSTYTNQPLWTDLSLNENMKHVTVYKKRPLSIFACRDPVTLDLLSKMLTLDPSQRISSSEALKHEYFINVSEKTCYSINHN